MIRRWVEYQMEFSKANFNTVVTTYKGPTGRETKDQGVITTEKLEFGDHPEKIAQANQVIVKW